MKPNCYECTYRGGLAGSAHSCCKHPAFEKGMDNPMAQILGIFASVGRVAPTRKSLKQRRKILEGIYDTIAQEKIKLSKWHHIGFEKLYADSIQGEINEGIVIKRIDSKYPISYDKCMQNPQWLKVKKDGEHLKTEGK